MPRLALVLLAALLASSSLAAQWIKERLIIDTELIDEICLENEKSLQHMQ